MAATDPVVNEPLMQAAATTLVVALGAALAHGRIRSRGRATVAFAALGFVAALAGNGGAALGRLINKPAFEAAERERRAAERA